MIITRSPLRITLGGGGTDLPSYYEHYGGFVLAAAIDKYVMTIINRSFSDEFLIRYSHLERVKRFSEIKHPIVRTCFELYHREDDPIEITSIADIPAGTGLGSSGSFTTALLRALHKLRRISVQPLELASEACRIELDILKEPIGKQDQFIAAFGGITSFEFHPDGKVSVVPLSISENTATELEENLVIFSTGKIRSASEILRDQDTKSRAGESQILENLHSIKDIGFKSRDVIEQGHLDEFGRLLDEHWKIKRKRSSKMSNSAIDEIYEFAMKNSALGGKLIGAGGGGFLVFYSPEPNVLRKAVKEKFGIKELTFSFDYEGTKVLS